MMGEYDAGYENYIDGLHREIIDYQIEVEQVKGENERLRELVRDYERGVGSYTHEAPAAVCLAFFDGKRWHDCWESTGGEVNVTFSMTTQQAIDATLGRGTCHITVEDNLNESEGMGDVWLECDECHWQMPLETSTPRFNYCLNCGKQVVE